MRMLRKSLAARVVPAAGLAACLSMAAVAAFAQQPKTYHPADSGSVAPADLRSALSKPDNFQIHHKVADIPAEVQAAFAKVVGLKALAMAEPGAPWQATDVIMTPNLPGRRLSMVAISRGYCLIFYQRGGIASSDNVAIFRLSGTHAAPAGHAYLKQSVTDLVAARAAFADSPALDSAY